jgi:hypothetical protein
METSTRIIDYCLKGCMVDKNVKTIFQEERVKKGKG